MNQNRPGFFSKLIVASVFAMLFIACTSEDSVPSIKQRVDEYNKKAMSSKDGPKLSEQDMAVMKKAADDLAKTLPDPGLKVGDTAPDFVLGNANGKSVSLSSKLKDGPVVLIFYRGAWCPYCNIQLHALQESLPAFKKQGAQLVAAHSGKPLPEQKFYRDRERARRA